MNRFNNKNVIVTGAGSGFGAAIANRFASEGANVLLSDINQTNVEAVARDIQATGSIETNVANVSEESDIIAMVEQANSAFGGIDVLVNNAGYSHLNKLLWKSSRYSMCKIACSGS